MSTEHCCQIISLRCFVNNNNVIINLISCVFKNDMNTFRFENIYYKKLLIDVYLTYDNKCHDVE